MISGMMYIDDLPFHEQNAARRAKTIIDMTLQMHFDGHGWPNDPVLRQGWEILQDVNTYLMFGAEVYARTRPADRAALENSI